MKLFRTLAVLLVGMLGVAASPAEAQYTVIAGGAKFVSPGTTVLQWGCYIGDGVLRPDGVGGYGNLGDFALSKLDEDTCTYIPVSYDTPGAIAFAPDGRQAYVLSSDGSLEVIDYLTNTVVREADTHLPRYYDEDTQTFEGASATGIAVSPDGTRIFLPGVNNNNLAVLDGRTLELVAMMQIADVAYDTGTGQSIALKWTTNPDDRRIYINSAYGLRVYSATTYEMLATIPMLFPQFWSPTGVVLSPDGTHLYMATGNGVLVVVDTATNAIVTTLTLDPGVFLTAGITPDGAHLYVAGGTKVFVVDTATNTVSAIGQNQSFRGFRGVAALPLQLASFHVESSLPQVLDEPFSVSGSFSLGAGNNGIDLTRDNLTLAVGTHTLWLAAGSFAPSDPGAFHFNGDLDTTTGTVHIDFEIHSAGDNIYAFTVSGTGLDLDGEIIPIQALLVVGDDAGTTSVDVQAGLHQTISDLQSQVSASQALTSSLQSQNDALVQANAALIQQVTALTAQVQPLTDQVQALTTINQSLTTENVRLTANNTQLTTTIATSHARIEHLEARVTNLQARIDTLETHLTTAHATVEDLRSKLADARDRSDALRAKLDTAQATEADLRQQIAQLQQDLNDALKKKK